MPPPTSASSSSSSAPPSASQRIGAFEYLLGGILLTAAGFVIDLINGSLPAFTIAFAVIAMAVGAARIFAGYRRGRRSESAQKVL